MDIAIISKFFQHKHKAKKHKKVHFIQDYIQKNLKSD